MNGFKIINSGLFTLIQDKGRFNLMSIGVTNSGAMDEYAYLWANKLLNNDLNNNVLEIAFSGLCLESNIDTIISITGADFNFTLNEKYYEPWQTIRVYKGDILKFCKSLNGQRAYLSVKDGFNIEKEFNSVSTTIKEGLGGLEGKALKKNDFLESEEFKINYINRLKKDYIPKYKNELELRVTLGYQSEYFTQEEKDKFFNSTFEVSKESSRMGIKFDGEKIQAEIDGIISEGICFGAIQIPKDGRPIVLLKDRQTIGGYPKIGSVLNVDCYKLAQAKVGTKIIFKEISIKEALKINKDFHNSFK